MLINHWRKISLAAFVLLLYLFFFGPLRWIGLSLIERGGPRWIETDRTPHWLQAALSRQAYRISEKMSWQSLLPGFETAILLVNADDDVLEKIHLLRVDPARFKFSVHVDPPAYRDADEWIDELAALAVINGSYYTSSGYPATPVKSMNGIFGPADYIATHGAFATGAQGARIVDLAGIAWPALFESSEQVMLSYPLLFDASGKSRVHAREDWYANRSFIAMDRSGQMVLGCTERAFFSLPSLGKFLQTAPLDLELALNLDGGPVASLAIRAAGHSTTVYGKWEFQKQADKLISLEAGRRSKKWSLPIVLAVTPKIKLP